MTKAPLTVEEARARQATIAGGLGALAPDPIVKEEPLLGSLGAAMKKRQTLRREASAKLTRWK